MNAQASIAANYTISLGLDNSDGLNDTFLPTEILRLGSSDDDRVQSNGNWPIGNYDESKYIEFVFSPSVPSDAVIESVNLTHEYYESVKLTAAKLEVWNGSSFVDYTLQLPVTSGTANETSETINIFNTVNTANLVNGLRVRFLAYRATTASSIKTSHDLMNLNVTYSIPEIIPPVIVDPDPIPEPTPDPAPEPDPIPVVDPIPEPIPEIIPEPEIVTEIPVAQEPVIKDPEPTIQIPESNPVAENTSQENSTSNNGSVPFFMLGNSTLNTNDIKIETNIVNAPTVSDMPPVLTETSQNQEQVIESSVPVDIVNEDVQNIETFESIPEQDAPTDPKIDPNLALAAAGTVGNPGSGDNNWWILLLFVILGSYLAIRIRQKPKSQKL